MGLNNGGAFGGNIVADVELGDVDVLSLPSGNLGQQVMAASLSVVPASDVTDATYIGDIKFGEALPAGSNAIGKLAANSGVDIGDVDIGSALPAGTNAIGKLAANSGVDIGDVDVLSLPAAKVVDSNHFQATITSTNASSATTVKAKTAAKKIYVTSLIMSTDTQLTLQLQSDNVSPQIVMEQAYFAADGGLALTFTDPLIVNTNEDLDVIASGAGNISVTVTGYVV